MLSEVILLSFVLVPVLVCGWSGPRFLTLRRTKLAMSHARELNSRTTHSLDFDRFLSVLSSSTRTLAGKQRAESSFFDSAASVTNSYNKLKQLDAILPLLSWSSTLASVELLNHMNTSQHLPSRQELKRVSDDIAVVQSMLEILTMKAECLSLFSDTKDALSLSRSLVSTYSGSFEGGDHEGAPPRLNRAKYPALRRISERIDDAESQIMYSLRKLCGAADYRDKLAENPAEPRFINGRFTLPFLSTHKRGLGVVRGISQSGYTVYVEPHSIVKLGDDLEELRIQFRAEESGILFDLTRCLIAHKDELQRAILAVADLDVMQAKICLAKRMTIAMDHTALLKDVGKQDDVLGQYGRIVIPEVGESGIINCHRAFHPLLLLQRYKQLEQESMAADVVGNTITLSDDTTAVVISGPNAGGKTIALKTAGFLALMVRYAIPLPVNEGSRVDFFPTIVADIGDTQNIENNTSTFSGHLIFLKEMLGEVKMTAQQGKHSLVLLDEAGTGTDPIQGAALAQAVLEELIVDSRPIDSIESPHALKGRPMSRVMLTTHYLSLKSFAASNGKVETAAMEFHGDKPTFRLKMGSVGDSFALQLAQRLGLSSHIVNRATSLLKPESQHLVALASRLEAETAAAQQLQQAYNHQLSECLRRVQGLKEQEQALSMEISRVRQGFTDTYTTDLASKAKEFNDAMVSAKQLMQELVDAQRLRAKEGGSTKKALDKVTLSSDKVWQEVCAVSEQVQEEQLRLHREKALKDLEERFRARLLAPREIVKAGSMVVLLQPGICYGCQGMVSRDSNERGRIAVKLAGTEMRVQREFVALPIRTIDLHSVEI